MKKEEFQTAVLTELRSLNKTLQVIASNQERPDLNQIKNEIGVYQEKLVKKLGETL